MRLPLTKVGRIAMLAMTTTVLYSPAFAALAQDSTAVTTAVTQTGQRTQVYQAAYFDQFQPQSAFDMVLRVPGFSFDGGDQARGFAGTAGNVLIDGQRPATKDHLGNILSGISASQVERVEYIIGGAPGIDMQGHTEIVNVVRKSSSKPSWTFTGVVRNYQDYRKELAGVVGFALNDGDKVTSFNVELFDFTDNGTNHAYRNTWLPDRSDTSPDFTDIPQMAGGSGSNWKLELQRPMWGGKLSFNGSYNLIDYDSDSQYISEDGVATEHYDYKEISSETGLKFTRPLTSKLSMDINILSRHERERNVDDYREETYTGLYDGLAIEDEEIVSGKLSWQKTDKVTYRIGSEIVFNSMENVSTYLEDGIVQGIPNAQVRVEEDRTESFISSNWQIRPKLSLESTLKVETSTIAVPDDNRSESFVYPKPKFQLVWSPVKSLKLTWRTEREVEQLRFGDFASSVELSTEVIKAGNSNIVPQKQWINGLKLDYSFWEKGSFSIGVDHYDIEDTLDHLPITTDEGVFDARGNIGNASGMVWESEVTLPLDRFHIKGGEFKASYSQTHTSVVDPVTGLTRQISGVDPEEYSVSFSQNFTSIRSSWGFEVGSVGDNWVYTTSEAYHFSSEPWTTLWAEYKTKSNVTFTILAQNPFSAKVVQQRLSYADLRGKSPLDLEQETISYRRPFIALRIRKEL